jgi:hypothetical protein
MATKRSPKLPPPGDRVAADPIVASAPRGTRGSLTKRTSAIPGC